MDEDYERRTQAEGRDFIFKQFKQSGIDAKKFECSKHLNYACYLLQVGDKSYDKLASNFSLITQKEESQEQLVHDMIKYALSKHPQLGYKLSN